jgi:hypothetical protein
MWKMRVDDSEEQPDKKCLLWLSGRSRSEHLDCLGTWRRQQLDMMRVRSCEHDETALWKFRRLVGAISIPCYRWHFAVRSTR